MSFFEKKEIGHHSQSICCCRTAPTPMSVASTTTLVGASSFGYVRRVAVATGSLMAMKAVIADSVQASSLELLVAEETQR